LTKKFSPDTVSALHMGNVFIKMRSHLLLAILVALAGSPALSLDIDVEYLDLRPIRPPTIHVTLTGEIEEGDTQRIKAAISPYTVDNALFLFDSPGGSLMEGLEIGRFIQSLSYTTNSQVGTLEKPGAICASSCVYAFLGADYRYLSEGALIGVHKFYSDDAGLTGADALDLSQSLTALIASFLLEARVSPTFLNDIVSASSGDMNWVSVDRLNQAHVLTQGIYSETVEYRNIDGRLVLSVEQIAEVGASTVLLTCGPKGIIGYSSLSEPEIVMLDTIQVVINEVNYDVVDPQLINRDDRLLKSAFILTPDAVRAMEAHSEIGVIATTPGGDLFFGFIGSVKDAKIAELAASCKAVAQPEAQPGMTRYNDTDILGGDLTQQGIRGISLEECEHICISASDCAGVSYVISKQWCWPKASNGVVMPTPGVVTSLR
jgi:hypothetical protein